MTNFEPIKKVLIEADQNGKLIGCLVALEGRVRRIKLGPVLCELHNSGQISLVTEVNMRAISELRDDDFWTVIHPLDQAIPDMTCSHREVLVLVGTLVKRAGADGAAGLPNHSLVQWSKSNPRKAAEIVTDTQSGDQLCMAHCMFAIQGIGDPELAYGLLENVDKAVVAVGLRSLGRLDLTDAADNKRLIDECYKAVREEKSQDVRTSAIEAAFKTWERMGQSEPYLQSELISAVDNANKGTELALLSAMLFYHSSGLVANSIDLVLVAVKSDAAPAVTVLDCLDQALYAKDERWSFDKVAEVFAKQIPRLSEPAAETNKYTHFCEWVWEKPHNASKLFASWLLDGQAELCSFLADMVGVGDGENWLVEISRADLPGEAAEQYFLARKCIGFMWLHEVTVASILLSIVKHGKKMAREAVEALLFDPLLLSYGGALRDYLITQRNSQSKRVAQCAQRLLAKHETYITGLEQANDLVEFLPTNAQRRTAAAKDHERNKDIQKQAQNRSIFADIMSHSTLLYGKKSFTMIYGTHHKKTPSIMPLTEVSYSTELPRLSVIDSVGFHATLTTFRLEKRIKR